jgi:hypothetical protein
VELEDVNPEKLTEPAENMLNKSEYFISGFIPDDMEKESSLIDKLKEICSFTYNLIGNEVNLYSKNNLIDKESVFEGMKIKTFSKKISGIYINNPSNTSRLYKIFTNNT